MDDLVDRVAALEHSLREREAHLTRRLRFWRGVAVALAVGALLLSLRAATAQGSVAGLSQRVAALEDLLTHFSRAGNDIFITGANLHIRNGLGSTDTTNSLGNLIVGYNETGNTAGDLRTGSHNVIVGRQQNFASFGGLVVGQNNRILGQFASVSGGANNTASGFAASVSGGANNTASGQRASVSGGGGNTASGISASVSGGGSNTASGDGASVSGGDSNQASGERASVSGGLSNTATGNFASVSGGGGVAQGTGVGWSAGSEGGATFVGNFRSPWGAAGS
jgi:hypothetical protein